MKPTGMSALLAAILMGGCTHPAQELVLRYDRPADYFEEALPIGNGQLGSASSK